MAATQMQLGSYITTDDDEKKTTNKVEHKSVHPTWSGASIPMRLDAHVRSISQIDSVNQTFRAKLHVYVYRGLTPREQKKFDLLKDKNEFKPEMYLSFEPQYSVERIRFERVLWNNGKEFVVGHLTLLDCISVVYCFIVDCVFLEEFELINFPFDIQHFEIQLEFHCEQQNDALGLYPFNINLQSSGVMLSPNGANSIGWEFVGLEYGVSQFNFTNKNTSAQVATRILTEHNGLTTDDVISKYNRYINNDKEVKNFAILFTGMYSNFFLRMKFQRQWRFFFSRVVVVLGILSFLSLFCFVFGNDTIADRFGFVSNMLLAGVAYTFIVTQYIPSLNYLTLLDKYVYFTFVFLLLLGVENGILGLLIDIDYFEYVQDNQITINHLLLASNFVLWIAIHFYFYVQSRQAFIAEIKKIGQTKEQVEEDKRLMKQFKNNSATTEVDNASHTQQHDNRNIYEMGIYKDSEKFDNYIKKYVIQQTDTFVKSLVINNQE